jgi:hypothetical protein
MYFYNFKYYLHVYVAILLTIVTDDINCPAGHINELDGAIYKLLLILGDVESIPKICVS